MGILSGIGNFLGNAFGTIFQGAGQINAANKNYKAQQEANRVNKEIAEKNLAFQQQAFQYNKDLNTLQMQRQDTSYQRAVADAQKAGFSPLVASGVTPSAATVSTLTAPQMNYHAQAPMMQNPFEGLSSFNGMLSATKKAEADLDYQNFLKTVEDRNFNFLSQKENQRIKEFYDSMTHDEWKVVQQSLENKLGRDFQESLARLNYTFSEKLKDKDFDAQKTLKALDHTYNTMMAAIEHEYFKDREKFSKEQQAEFEQKMHLFRSENLTPQEEIALIMSLTNVDITNLRHTNAQTAGIPFSASLERMAEKYAEIFNLVTKKRK
ncbi:putative VP2 [Microviridae sp.]|nr:putative VP2 [Microviridae sp.]